MFFEYSQNNSGGGFDFEEWKVTEYVIVEADDDNEADRIAQGLGVYFDDNYEIDCDCCGTRWSQASSWDKSPLPSKYGTPIWRQYLNPPTFDIDWMRGKPETYVHYKDGTIEAWTYGKGLTEIKEPTK